MGLSFVKPDVNINFMGFRKACLVGSALLILIGVASLLVKGGPRYGIDFAGGMMVQVKFQKEVDLKDFRKGLETAQLPDMVVQRFGLEGSNEYLVRIPAASGLDSTTVRQRVNDALGTSMPDAGHEIQRLEMVGPKVGADLRAKALEALFYAVLLIAIYISGRFEQRWWAAALMAGALSLGVYLLGLVGVETGLLTVAALLITIALCWKLKLNYALGAVVALVHDVTITVGVFSLLNKEFDLTIVAALLTIVGYSLNDTIIVYDRIRENLRAKKYKSLAETINRSINQTLSRTLLTSGTTLLAVAALYFFGGGVIHDFALAMLVGVAVGTYSSIFVAGTILLGFKPTIEEEECAPAETTA
ncbi:MAG: protein translocase subunit SecF [Desulfovibrionaceae bacterium]|jgi:preprotein translocase subunit SecF|nr:protein translocase subunit SecF [Desulfovibrionaceae bacterium]